MSDISTTMTRVQSLITTAVAGAPIYWGEASLPAALPAKFVVISALFVSTSQSWSKRTHQRHTLQVRACAKTIGEATKLASDIEAALPANEFELLTSTVLTREGAHYDMTITPQTHASGA